MPPLSIYQLALVTGLVGCVTASVIARDGSKGATAFALLGNWIANTVFTSLCGETYPWMMFMVVDYLSALVIFGWRSSRWQSAIMGVYAAQILCHVAFAQSRQGIAAHYYGWWALYYMALLQIALFGGWCVADLLRHRGWAFSRAPFAASGADANAR